MEGLSLKPDNWQYISTFLTIKELCRLTCVSRACFFFWMEDRYWSYQKQRVCFHFPELSPLFEENSYAKKKRKKSEWSMPRKGTWWVFKRYLHAGTHMEGFKKICKKEDTRALAIAVVSLNIPMRELITGTNVFYTLVKRGPNASICRIYFWSPSLDKNNYQNRTTCFIRRGSNSFDFQFRCSLTDQTYFYERLFSTTDHFNAWKSFLFQKDYIPCWNDLFLDLIQNKPE
jgi:hypothetical protein